MKKWTLSFSNTQWAVLSFGMGVIVGMALIILVLMFMGKL
jgi:hypothetical protein